MTVLDLFSGIGGFALAWESAGADTVAFAEVDPFASSVLARHWPDVPNLGDVRGIRGLDVGAVDVICGGFPCQDISSAGKGAGITGKRSGLWFAMLRLVRELRPAWVLAENVPTLRTRGADIVLAGLEAEGYTCWPTVVGAWAVGAPHRRDRVWIVAHRSGERRREAWINLEQPAQRVAGGCDALAHCDSERREELKAQRIREQLTPRHDLDRRHLWPARPGEPQLEHEHPRTVESPLGSTAHGLSADVVRRARSDSRLRRNALRAYGNSIVPQVAAVFCRWIMAQERA